MLYIRSPQFFPPKDQFQLDLILTLQNKNFFFFKLIKNITPPFTIVMNLLT